MEPAGRRSTLTEERLAQIEAGTQEYHQWRPLIAELVAEVRRLRALLPQAIAVGYAKREAEEAQERSDCVKRHPVYQREADGDRTHYEAMLATLNRALEAER